MLSRTHVAMSLFVGLLLINQVQNPAVFILAVIASTFIPDIDSYNSKLGKRFSSRVLTAFTKHRGIMHSLLFLSACYALLYFYVPAISLGFLVGYGIHLFGDMMTKQGVRIFYPFKFRVRGFVKTGGRIEDFIFLFFGIADIALIVKVTFLFFFSY